MRIGLVQCVSLPGNITANLDTVLGWVKSASEAKCAIVCFPEYMLTGAPSKDDGAPNCVCDTETLSALSEAVEKHHVTVLAGSMRAGGSGFYSSCIVGEVNGELSFIDKIHPGKLEKSSLSAGKELRSFQIPDSEWCFSALLCNDWHQPWCSFFLAHQGVRILFAPFSTPHIPAKRIELWRRFMPTRAYDCRSFILSCNRLREDGRGGGLACWGPDGAELYSFDKAPPHLGIVDVSLETLTKYTVTDNDMRYKDFPTELNTNAIRYNLK